MDMAGDLGRYAEADAAPAHLVQGDGGQAPVGPVVEIPLAVVDLCQRPCEVAVLFKGVHGEVEVEI